MRHLRSVEWTRFCEADEAWGVELVIAFGKNASHERYYGDHNTHPDHVKAAYKIRDAARIEAVKLIKFFEDA